MAAAFALGQRGHHVVVLESAPKVSIEDLLKAGPLTDRNTAYGDRGRYSSLSKYVANV